MKHQALRREIIAACIGMNAGGINQGTSGNVSVRIPEGHRVRAWVMAGNQASYQPYPTAAGGLLRMGDASTLALPLRSPAKR